MKTLRWTTVVLALALVLVAASLAPSLAAAGPTDQESNARIANTDGLSPTSDGECGLLDNSGVVGVNCGEASFSVDCDPVFVARTDCEAEGSAMAYNWVNPGDFEIEIEGDCTTSQTVSWTVGGDSTTRSCAVTSIFVPDGECITFQADMTVSFDGTNAPGSLTFSDSDTACN